MVDAKNEVLPIPKIRAIVESQVEASINCPVKERKAGSAGDCLKDRFSLVELELPRNLLIKI